MSAPTLLPMAFGSSGYGQPFIQVLLIAGVLAIAFLLLRSQGARHQALRRILLVLFALAAVGSIVFPQAWTAIANLLGVGRGTDLLLYVLIIAFLSYVATRYAKDRRVERQMTELARRIALDEAPPARSGPADGAGGGVPSEAPGTAPGGEGAGTVPGEGSESQRPGSERPGGERPEAGGAPWTG